MGLRIGRVVRAAWTGSEKELIGHQAEGLQVAVAQLALAGRKKSPEGRADCVRQESCA
jgi:hypothetical protein